MREVEIHVGDTGYAVFAKRVGSDGVGMFTRGAFDHYMGGMPEFGVTPVVKPDQSVDFGNYHESPKSAQEMAARDARIRELHARGLLGEGW